MADEVQAIEQPQQTASNQASADLDAQMKLSLGNYVKQWNDIPAPIEQPAPTTQEPPANAVQPTTDTPQPTLTDIPAATIENPFETIKSKFNYQTAEDAIKEIEELRALKNNPIKYENAESERLHKAIIAGKEKRQEALAILNRQDKIEKLIETEVNKDSAADIVKMGMQLKYQDLTPEEINYRFNKQFALPPKPIQTDIEDDTEYQNRVTTWQEQVNDKTMELMIEAKLAKPEIANANTKLELPNIENPLEQEYLKWKKDMEEVDKLDAAAKTDYQNYKPEALLTKIDFNDEANKIAFQYQFTPDEKSFNEAIELVSDFDKFWGLFQNSDGSPNRSKFINFVYKGLNADNMVKEGIKQGSNARFKAQLPDNSNNLVRHMPQTFEQSDLDKQMEQAGIKRAG